MANDFFNFRGSFTRVHYFISLFLAALLWGLMVLVFEGPAKQQFSESNVLPDAITITPPLLFYLFAASKRFRHIGTHWWWRLLFLAAVSVLAVSDLVWPDFANMYRFYHRVLMSSWVIGTVLLLLWPGPEDKIPGYTGQG